MTKISAKDVTPIGIMSAVLIAGKAALSFLPNVEIVTLLIIVYTLYFGKKVFFSIFIFIILDCAVWGFNLWTVMYIYVWPLLAIMVLLFAKHRETIFWSIISAVFGLAFGGMCSLVYVFTGGLKTALAWWIAGIPFDIIHCISNFILTAVLFRPLTSVMDMVKKAS